VKGETSELVDSLGLKAAGLEMGDERKEKFSSNIVVTQWTGRGRSYAGRKYQSLRIDWVEKAGSINVYCWSYDRIYEYDTVSERAGH